MKKFGNFLIKVGFVVMLLAIGTLLVYDLPGLRKWVVGGIGTIGIFVGLIGFLIYRDKSEDSSESEDDYYKYIRYQ